MSMFMVPKAHIDVLTTLIVRSELVPSAAGLTPDLIGLGLWLENWNSGKARYPAAWGNEGDWPENPERLEVVQAYRYEAVELPTAATEIGGTILRNGYRTIVQCYQYQACEHSTWDRSPAYRWTTELVLGLDRPGEPALPVLSQLTAQLASAPGLWPISSHEEWREVVRNVNEVAA